MTEKQYYIAIIEPKSVPKNEIKHIVIDWDVRYFKDISTISTMKRIK